MGHLKIKYINLSLILLPRWILGIIYMYTIFLLHMFARMHICQLSILSPLNLYPISATILWLN